MGYTYLSPKPYSCAEASSAPAQETADAENKSAEAPKEAWQSGLGFSVATAATTAFLSLSKVFV